jgi:oligo-1,6-glucosidase
LYWNNHDQPRAVSRFGDDGEFWEHSAKLLGAVLHLQRGTPYIFQGEELGMTNVPFEGIEHIRDIESRRYFDEAMAAPGANRDEVFGNILRSGRDNARTPMQWSTEAHGGFTTGEPWIEANPNFARVNASAQRGSIDSIFEFYRSLIRIRHKEPVVVHGDFRMLEAEHPSLFSYVRSLGDTQLLVIANFSDTALDLAPLPEFAVADWQGAALLLANYPEIELADPLRPWEVRVLLRH